MTDEPHRDVEQQSRFFIGCAPQAKPVRDWLRLLPAGMAPAVLALTLGLSGAAVADIQGDPLQPAFTAADRAAIARNASLRETAARDPWVVYRVLRAIDAAAPSAGLRATYLRFLIPSRRLTVSIPRAIRISETSSGSRRRPRMICSC